MIRIDDERGDMRCSSSILSFPELGCREVVEK